MRLNKILAEAGCCSRRKADEYIKAGDVTVNGIKICELGSKIDSESDKIELNGRPIKINNQLVYYGLYKPRGVVSTARSEVGDKTVTELVPPSPRVYPVGRLDKSSEGLIILTNDGELTKELTHPSFEHEKEYILEARIMNQELWKRYKNKISEVFTNGLLIEGKIMRADKIGRVMIRDSKFIIQGVVLHTGYNRQIRKMCAKIGLEVVKLTRVRVGNLRLNDLGLKEGEYKAISRQQIL